MLTRDIGHAVVFLLTRLLRGVTAYNNPELSQMEISTHTPLARRDTSEN